MKYKHFECVDKYCMFSLYHTNTFWIFLPIVWAEQTNVLSSMFILADEYTNHTAHMGMKQQGMREVESFSDLSFHTS